MKKTLSILLLLALMAAPLLTLTACDGTRNSPLVGSWLCDEIPGNTYTFRANGRGSRGVGSNESFRWSVRGDTLRITHGNYYETWTFSVNDDRLTLTPDGSPARFTFTRIDGDLPEIELANDPALVGTWNWSTDEAYIYEFHADGTGRRGVPRGHEMYAQGHGLVSLTWSTSDNILTMSIEGHFPEAWEYDITGNTLILDGMGHRAAETHAYINHSIDMPAVSVPNEHPIMGTWAWDEDSAWMYVFNPDGSGSMGGEAITWAVSEDGILYVYPGLMGIGDWWDYDITDDVLTLTSRQVVGAVYRYLRADLAQPA